MEGVTIVIPVYNARALTRRCVESILEHSTGDWRLTLVDDASTDPGLRDELQRVAEVDPHVRLLINETNQGFIKSANRGMREVVGRDVLLMNSDTEVFASYLERLRACAYADSSTGIVSPLSNNATSCSVPEFGRDNPIPEGFTGEAFARMVAACSKQRRPELVTAVGFCMYVKAIVLERVGYFDERFGRGFGEENDLCERAKNAGFTVRLCDDVFVYHKGKGSFGPEGWTLESTNAALLEAKQPGYHLAVAKFVADNPLAPIQEEIGFHSARLGKDREQALLFLVGKSPFATTAGERELRVRDLLRAVALPRAVVAYLHGQELVAAEVLGGAVENPIFYRFELSERVKMFSLVNEEILHRLGDLVRLFGISGIQIHQPFYWPLTIARAMQQTGLSVIYGCHESEDAPALELQSVSQDYRLALIDFLGQVDLCAFPSEDARELINRQLSNSLRKTRIISEGLHVGRAYRDLYAELGMMPVGDQIPTPEVLHEIFARRDPEQRTVFKSLLSKGPSAPPKYQSSSWYPAFLKVKPLIPEAVRSWGRQVLVRLEELGRVSRKNQRS